MCVDMTTHRHRCDKSYIITITDTCLDPDEKFDIVTNKVWREIDPNSHLDFFHRQPVVYRSLWANHVYCPFHNITMEKENVSSKCPPYPFSLPLNVSFKTGNIDYKITSGHANITPTHIEPLDVVLSPISLQHQNYTNAMELIARMQQRTSTLR